MILGVIKYVLFTFRGFVGLVVLCLLVDVGPLLSVLCFKSACRTVNPMEEEMRLLKLTNSLQQLKKDDVNALL